MLDWLGWRHWRPLYLQLHTWASTNLAEKYHQPSQEDSCAWMNNRWAQEGKAWSTPPTSTSIFGGPVNRMIARLLKQFSRLASSSPWRKVFGRKSDLYPVHLETSVREYPRFLLGSNFDLENDIRSPPKHRTDATLVFSLPTTSSVTVIFKSVIRGPSSVLAPHWCCALFPRAGRTNFTASSQVPYLHHSESCRRI